MSLGIQINRSGDILPYVKINGKDGTVSRSTYDGANRGHEFVEDFVALFDFDTLQIGWIKMGDQGPDKRLVARGETMPVKPGDDYKQGVQFCVSLPGGLGVHEIMTNAAGVLGALEDLSNQVQAAPENSQGQVPVVRLAEIKTEGKGTKSRAIPRFEVIGWKDRPAELAARKVSPRPLAAMPSANGAKPAATGSTPMTPPANAYAAQKPAATISADDFG